jgi:hypothetical protein
VAHGRDARARARRSRRGQGRHAPALRRAVHVRRAHRPPAHAPVPPRPSLPSGSSPAWALWVDARTLLPERYRDDFDDNGVRKTSDTRIPEDAERITIAFRHGDRESEATFEAAGEVLDALSAVYYLRAARLAPGDRLCFDVIASRRYWRFEGTVAAEPEPVETPAGRFQTIRVDAVARRADRPDARARPVHVWFSLDSRRLPVAAVSEIELGPVRAELSSVRGARQR